MSNAKKEKIERDISKYPMVCLTTLDWLGDASWLQLSKARKMEPATAFAMGRLLRKTSKKFTIFSSWSFDEDGAIEVGGIDVIPRTWVKDIKYLKSK